MKKTFFLVLFLQITAMAISQTKALTGNGDEVILFNDGTWKYANKEQQENENKNEGKVLTTNPGNFVKKITSAFEVKSNKTNASVFINPKKWSFTKAETGEASEYAFQLKDKDAYAMIITEKIEVPLGALQELAINNAKEAAPDIKVVKEEYRIVNGKKMICMQMNGTIQGIKFTYFGYYYSSTKGTIQMISYTSQNLLDEYLPDMEDLLNGLAIKD